MIHVALSLLVGTVVTVVIGLAFGWPSVKVAYGIVPGIIAAIAFFVWRSRIVMKDLQSIMGEVQQYMKPKNPMKPSKPNIERAVKIIQKGDKWRKWQPFVGAQLDGQIGMLYYMDGKYKTAQPYLEKALNQNWMAKAMLACIHYRRKDQEEMNKVFEEALKGGKKESLLWNTYAWCNWKLGDTDKAIAVLNRGKEKVSSDERTRRNLNALSNGRKMKMHRWAEQWYQFRLEKPRQQQMGPGGGQHFSRRNLYRG
jgi:tetratricopeptide (TPR) repeat protein